MEARKFNGPFASYIIDFIKGKRTIGCKYAEEERILFEFDNFSSLYISEEGLTKEIVNNFVKSNPNWTPGTQRCHINIMRQFASYLNGHGIRSYVCDYKNFPKYHKDYVPYIFTHKEISSIFEKADEIPIRSNNMHAHYFYPLIFRILYSCGLRVSEATNLKIRDVNQKDGYFHIRNTKTKKDRIVPMHESLLPYVKHFYENIHIKPNDQDYFFKSPVSDKYSISIIYSRFRKLIWECGISHSGRKKGGPRVHDLRHTFAVHSLRQFILNRTNVNVALPYLSAYMGHSTIQSTESYLRLTADVFPECSKIMEEHLSKFPYKADEENDKTN